MEENKLPVTAVLTFTGTKQQPKDETKESRKQPNEYVYISDTKLEPDYTADRGENHKR